MAFCTRHSSSDEAFGRKPRISVGSSSLRFWWGQVLLLMFAKHSLVLLTGYKTLQAKPWVRDAGSTLGCNSLVA